MAGNGDDSKLSDAEFRATFSLLPHLLKLSKVLASGQTESQLVQQAVSDLQDQLQRCHKLLDTTPALDYTPEQQVAVLKKKREQLSRKDELLLKYKNLAVLSSLPTYR